jgi:xanthine dehydrogenase molybdenum-binding subunit
MATQSVSDYRVIGTSPIRSDAYDKVTGKAVFGSDVKVPGGVWGDILRSEHSHARILSIDVSEASKLPGVLAVITGDDFPEIGPEPIDMASDFVDPVYARENIMAGPKVMCVGHPVAAVAAVDRHTAAEAVKLIKVEYEPLEVVLDLDAATSPGAPILIEDLVADHIAEVKKDTRTSPGISGMNMATPKSSLHNRRWS